jgi:hypothetical protein
MALNIKFIFKLLFVSYNIENHQKCFCGSFTGLKEFGGLRESSGGGVMEEFYQDRLPLIREP